MKRDLEEFININRSSFDDIEVRDGLWNKIDIELNVQTSPSLQRMYYWKVAAAILLVATSMLLVDKFSSNSSVAEPNLELLSEFQQAEHFYFSQISHKQEELLMYATKEEAKIYNEEMAKLDELYQELKSQATMIHNQRIVDEMTKNLQVRISILNYQLGALKKLNNVSTQNDDAESI